MPLDPRVAKVLRYLLVAIGGVTAATAIVEIVAAVKLLGPSDAESLGMSRNFVVTMNALQGLIGLALVYMGLRRRK